MTSGQYVVTFPNGRIDQEFGTNHLDYAQALMWATSQALILRGRMVVGYVEDDGTTITQLVIVSSPSVYTNVGQPV